MTKRNKRLNSGIKSLKEQINQHFLKIEKDILDDNFDLGGYHAKELDRSLIDALERKINLIGASKTDAELIKNYKNKLKEYKKKLGM